jgi:beta-lactam-binding protein with PASTA domain/predicted Ser/Thr protein kinase
VPGCVPTRQIAWLDSMATPPTIFADRYEIVSEIAHGGMADVYLARDSKLDRPVALKVLSPELSRDPAFVERFRREAQSAAGLNHPNIVGIFDWGQEHGTSFIVMEYIDGQTLRDMIRREGTIAPGQIADIGSDIAAALSFAHANGVVHRDVKPGNVLITTAGQVKVTDFGIARAGGDNDGLTRTGAVMGTATYFSPEQAQGTAVDGRSDVYSLGVVLYEMATGEPPFTGDSPVSVAYKHVREPVVPPSQKVPSIPIELERVIMTCLAKNPHDRYQTADDARADLLRFRRGQAVVGTAITAAVVTLPDATSTMVAPPIAPVPLATTTPAPPKKKKGPIIAVIVLLLLLIGVVGYLLVTQLGDDGSAATIPVPSVVGQPVAEAKLHLAAEKLTNVRVVRRANDQFAPGLVVRQDPSSGTKVAPDESILLTVSDGAGNTKVPDVVGEAFEDAANTLQSKGLNAVRTDIASDSVTLGQVVSTNPPADATVKRNSDVQVSVSAGPAPVNVPNVTGKDQVEAAQILTDAGLKFQKTNMASSSVPAGSVISTNPAAGTQAPRGSTVTMNVSTGPEQVAVPNVVGKTQEDATATLTDGAFDVRVVQVPSSASNLGKVITQAPLAGTTVNKGTQVTITVGTGPGTSTTTTT